MQRGERVGNFSGKGVMIRNDYVDAQRLGERNFRRARNSQIHRDEHVRFFTREFFHIFLMQTVTVFAPMRNAIGHFPTEHAERMDEQSRAAQTVDIIVPVNHNTFVSMNGFLKPLHRFLHVVEKKRIMQIFQHG